MIIFLELGTLRIDVPNQKEAEDLLLHTLVKFTLNGLKFQFPKNSDYVYSLEENMIRKKRPCCDVDEGSISI